MPDLAQTMQPKTPGLGRVLFFVSTPVGGLGEVGPGVGRQMNLDLYFELWFN
jgi:hypothetical protein